MYVFIHSQIVFFGMAVILFTKNKHFTLLKEAFGYIYFWLNKETTNTQVGGGIMVGIPLQTRQVVFNVFPIQGLVFISIGKLFLAVCLWLYAT